MVPSGQADDLDVVTLSQRPSRLDRGNRRPAGHPVPRLFQEERHP